MANPVSNIPVLLFPLKLETRFVGDELWIRAFPDTVFLQSHNPNLTTEEKADAKAFKELKQRNKKNRRGRNWFQNMAFTAHPGLHKSATKS
jgi:hypothetical protein